MLACLPKAPLSNPPRRRDQQDTELRTAKLRDIQSSYHHLTTPAPTSAQPPKSPSQRRRSTTRRTILNLTHTVSTHDPTQYSYAKLTREKHSYERRLLRGNSNRKLTPTATHSHPPSLRSRSLSKRATNSIPSIFYDNQLPLLAPNPETNLPRKELAKTSLSVRLSAPVFNVHPTSVPFREPSS